MKSMVDNEAIPWYKHGAMNVGPGKEAVLAEFNLKMAPFLTVYLRGLGHSYYDDNVEFSLVYDDVIWIRWTHQLGGVRSTDRYDLPSRLHVRSYVRLVVKNKTKTTRRFEGMLDGIFWDDDTSRDKCLLEHPLKKVKNLKKR